MADQNLIASVRASANRLGISPVDLLTAMSYETGGKLDPNLWGGKNNNYLGLIQFGPEERAKYGVKPGMPVAAHVTAAENFLRDRGVRPGMGLLDVYSTINAGAPGLYNRSDAANGGAPGTVFDKVRDQMAGHRQRAETMLSHPVPHMPIPMPQQPTPQAAQGGPMPLFAPEAARQGGAPANAPMAAQPGAAGQSPGPSIWSMMGTGQGNAPGLPLFAPQQGQQPGQIDPAALEWMRRQNSMTG